MSIPTKTEIITANTIHKGNLPTQIDFKSGILLLIDKPLDWTSFDVVNKLRFKLKHKLGIKKFKVGHAGTLDPLASGLLLICAGKYTKSIDTLSAMSKSYVAEVKLGAVTASYDAECDEEEIKDITHITLEMVESSLEAFRGDLSQLPPIYSAIKVDGQKAYQAARKGEEIALKYRPVTIFNLQLLSFEPPFVSLDITCSKGTYIRSLAHDLGQSLNCGGYLTKLVRTSIDHYQLSDALSLDEALEWIEHTGDVST